ncbi:NAD-dependent epimerase/dehydratase family protein [Myxococcota bacterium]|nr:NAD-dependent epimerase/dehydratase family protein [Myxococcota bacterium]
MQIFLTGGHGFIGSRVVRKLTEQGHGARCLVREKSDTKRIDDLPFTKTKGDVRDEASLVEGMRGCDMAIHLASVSAWADMQSKALEDTIIEGTKNVLSAAKKAGVKRVVHVSSVLAVNGSAEPRTFDETAPFELHGTKLRYSIAKHEAEKLCLAAAAGGLEVVMVNPGEVYGPNDDGFITAGNLKDMLVSWPALACTGGTAVTHVDDIADGTIAALTRGRSGERYILGGDNLSVAELVKLTLDLAGKTTPILKLPNGLVKGAIQGMAKVGLPTPVIPDVLDYATLFWFVDSSKAKRELGYSPRGAREAILPTLAWLYQAGHVKGKPGGALADAV